MLAHLALATLMLAAPPQATKHRRRAPEPAKAPAKAAEPVAAPPLGPNVVRASPCVLALKGTLTRVNKLPAPPKRARAGKSSSRATSSVATNNEANSLTTVISEQFDYELPGTLEEEVDPKGPIRFRFKPAADLNAAGGRGTLRFQDSGSTPGGTPTLVTASELTAADPFVFEAAGRGQGLVPISGLVYLRGRFQGPLPPGSPMSMEAPIRPVISVPLPPLQVGLNRSGASSLRFQGSSLWAWENAKGPFTLASAMDYHGPTGVGSVTGSVEVTFRVGATR